MNQPNENKKEAALLDHNYDGIQELDNPLPFWWLAIFYLCILFSIAYVFYYEFGDGPTLTQELVQDQQLIEAKQFEGNNAPKGLDENKLNSFLTDPAQNLKGKEIFTGKCASCHGPEGQGIIGPNLADNYWIHGDGSPKEVAQVIQKGVGDKGMPAWGAMLKEEEWYQVSAYVHSLKGSHPANPKSPQGNLVHE